MTSREGLAARALRHRLILLQPPVRHVSLLLVCRLGNRLGEVE